MHFSLIQKAGTLSTLYNIFFRKGIINLNVYSQRIQWVITVLAVKDYIAKMESISFLLKDIAFHSQQLYATFNSRYSAVQLPNVHLNLQILEIFMSEICMYI